MLHIVGGGSNNLLLNQFTADALKRDVVAGPGEGTVIGNLLVLAQAAGAVHGREEMSAVVERSFDTRTYKPGADADKWDAAYARYLKLIEK